MAFVRSKTVGGNEYYQLVRNYREEGKHRQEVIKHLGKHRSLREAIEAKQREIKELKSEITHWSKVARHIDNDFAVRDLINGEYGGKFPSLESAQELSSALSNERRKYSHLPASQQTKERLDELDKKWWALDSILRHYDARKELIWCQEALIQPEEELKDLQKLERKYP